MQVTRFLKIVKHFHSATLNKPNHYHLLFNLGFVVGEWTLPTTYRLGEWLQYKM